MLHLWRFGAHDPTGTPAGRCLWFFVSLGVLVHCTDGRFQKHGKVPSLNPLRTRINVRWAPAATGMQTLPELDLAIQCTTLDNVVVDLVGSIKPHQGKMRRLS